MLKLVSFAILEYYFEIQNFETDVKIGLVILVNKTDHDYSGRK